MTPKKLDDNICELELLNISSPTYECIHSLKVKQGLIDLIVGSGGSGGLGITGARAQAFTLILLK